MNTPQSGRHVFLITLAGVAIAAAAFWFGRIDRNEDNRTKQEEKDRQLQHELTELKIVQAQVNIKLSNLEMRITNEVLENRKATKDAQEEIIRELEELKHKP